MKKRLVSVVMSFLNAERFMREAVESVFGQSFESWELLLVDDGSTDKGTALALRYADDYPESVRYLEHCDHKNFGAAASRNVGVANAQGEFIAIIDADDVWLPHKLEQQVEILVAYSEAGMVFGSSVYWRSWTGHPTDFGRDAIVQAGVPMNALQDPPALLRVTLGGAQTPPPSDILLRTRAVLAVGGFETSFAGKYATFEDQAFLTKMFLNFPTFVSDKCWDKYRLHSDSLCATQEREGGELIARRFYLEWLDEYLASQDVPYADLRRMIRKALWAAKYPVAHDVAKHAFEIWGRLSVNRNGNARRPNLI